MSRRNCLDRRWVSVLRRPTAGLLLVMTAGACSDDPYEHEVAAPEEQHDPTDVQQLPV